MNQVLAYINSYSDWLVPFVPILCIAIFFAIESRWDAYVRRKNYEELKALNELREKSIITQGEFNERKEELLT